MQWARDFQLVAEGVVLNVYKYFISVSYMPHYFVRSLPLILLGGKVWEQHRLFPTREMTLKGLIILGIISFEEKMVHLLGYYSNLEK
jgi:hypothetical protein